jgi:hypothetical protein
VAGAEAALEAGEEERVRLRGLADEAAEPARRAKRDLDGLAQQAREMR